MTPQQIAGRASARKALRLSRPVRRKILKLAGIKGPDGKRTLTYAQIGERVGLTRQRVHAILKASVAA